MNLGECYWTARDLFPFSPGDVGAWVLPMGVPLLLVWQRRLESRWHCQRLPVFDAYDQAAGQ